jgi:hypothetical protein
MDCDEPWPWRRHDIKIGGWVSIETEFDHRVAKKLIEPSPALLGSTERLPAFDPPHDFEQLVHRQNSVSRALVALRDFCGPQSLTLTNPLNSCDKTKSTLNGH